MGVCHLWWIRWDWALSRLKYSATGPLTNLSFAFYYSWKSLQKNGGLNETHWRNPSCLQMLLTYGRSVEDGDNSRKHSWNFCLQEELRPRVGDLPNHAAVTGSFYLEPSSDWGWIFLHHACLPNWSLLHLQLMIPNDIQMTYRFPLILAKENFPCATLDVFVWSFYVMILLFYLSSVSVLIYGVIYGSALEANQRPVVDSQDYFVLCLGAFPKRPRKSYSWAEFVCFPGKKTYPPSLPSVPLSPVLFLLLNLTYVLDYCAGNKWAFPVLLNWNEWDGWISFF